MYALALSLFAFTVVLVKLALVTPDQESMFNNAIASSAASNFLAYRKATSEYTFANPATTGTIPDSSLTFSTGYVRNTAWTNTVQAGVLYTYSNRPIAAGTIESIANRSGRTLMVGVANAGQMVSLVQPTVTFTLPAAIPNGAVVMIGN